MSKTVTTRSVFALVLPFSLALGVGCTPASDGEPTPEPTPAVDGGEPEGTPDPVAPGDTCDPFTFVPECNAAAPWEKLTCSAGVNTVAAEDCREAIDATALTTCGEIACLDDGDDACDQFRITCLQPAEDGVCAVRNRFTDGTPCVGNQGCIFAFGDNGIEETCRPTTTCERGDENSICVGDIATWCVYDNDQTITWGTAQGVDCSTFGGGCGAHPTLGSVCEGVDGTLCNMVDATSVFHCAAGFVCDGDDAITAGTCIPE